jgi:hypothetical protein
MNQIFLKFLVTIPQQVPDNNENNDRSEAAASKFFCSVASDQASYQFVHFFRFGIQSNKIMPWILENLII